MADGSANTAAVLHGINDLRIEQVPHPGPPGDDEVLVHIKNVGICGSDCHYLTHGRIGPFVVNAPMIIGHESSGVVAAVGKNVTHLSVGTPVAIEGGVPCMKFGCEECATGKYNLCPALTFFATPPHHGSLCTVVRHPAALCFPLPSNVSLEEGALCEPLSVGVHACNRGGVTAGDKVLVLGAGPIGLVTAMVAKAFGAVHVTITDVNQARLDFARAHGGADAAVNIAGLSTEDTVAAVKKAAGGCVDRVVDACGFASAIHAGLQAVKQGGVMVLVGMGAASIPLPLETAIIREVEMRGSFRYRHCYPVAIDLIATGKVNVRPMVTHRLTGLDEKDTLEGFAIAKEGRDNAIKVMFTLP